jgi:chromate transporter
VTLEAVGDGERVSFATIAREWSRIGVTGFGGPPAHIVALRRLCVEDRGWLSARDFEDAIAAANLLPGPASTQLAIFCAWRLRGRWGALLGGVCFIVPGLTVILGLSVLFLGSNPPLWVLGAGAGAGAAVPAVALQAAIALIPASWKRSEDARSSQVRWVVYLVLGCASAATLGPFLVVVLLACGLTETFCAPRVASGGHRGVLGLVSSVTTTAPAVGGVAALVWVAFKVGALSYGGGFVIVPLMQNDAVNTYHWMTGAQFLNAVALGQITPGPVTQTVAAVGYSAGGIGAGLLAAMVAFAPSFIIVLGGAGHFDRVRDSERLRAFLTGAGAAAIGAIAGATIPLALALSQKWQIGVLAAAGGWLLVLRKSVVLGLFGAGTIGVLVALLGAPLPR